MALDKPYLDVPGTIIFDAEQSRKGYWLNQFCMSLMKAENRARFKADERAYLDEWAMSEEQFERRPLQPLIPSACGLVLFLDLVHGFGCKRNPLKHRLLHLHTWSELESLGQRLRWMMPR